MQQRTQHSGTGKALTAPRQSIPHVQPKTLVTAGKTVSFLNTSKCSDVTSIYWTSHFVAVYCRNILLNVETSEQLVCVLPGGWKRFWNKGRKVVVALILALSNWESVPHLFLCYYLQIWNKSRSTKKFTKERVKAGLKSSEIFLVSGFIMRSFVSVTSPDNLSTYCFSQ